MQAKNLALVLTFPLVSAAIGAIGPLALGARSWRLWHLRKRREARERQRGFEPINRS